MTTVVSLDYSQENFTPPKRKPNEKPKRSAFDERICRKCQSGHAPIGKRICAPCEQRSNDPAASEAMREWIALALIDRPRRGEEIPVELAPEIMKTLRARGIKPARPTERRGRTAQVPANHKRKVRVRKRTGQLAS